MSEHKQEHDFHLVDPSPWPIFGSAAVFTLLLGTALFIHDYPAGKVMMPVGLALVLYTMYVWWRDVVREGLEESHHTNIVRIGLRIGMALFILSEVMFFFAFFFSYFKSLLLPVDILDDIWPIAAGTWPPEGIKTFDPFEIPFVNTLILLLSGTTVTWAHHALLENKKQEMVVALRWTVFLGVLFTCLQAYEYSHATFSFTDGVYASNFYMATGFHGLHVIIGTLFLAVCLFRAQKGHFARGNGHLGFEFAAWYWHFVDVVWIFLFIFVYIVGK